MFAPTLRRLGVALALLVLATTTAAAQVTPPLVCTDGTTTVKTCRTWKATAGCVLTANPNGIEGDWNCSGAGGTVTSVGLALPSSVFSVSGSPVTTTGTLTGTLASQSANRVLASPNGSSGTPSFRALVAADIPAAASSSFAPLASDPTLATNTVWYNTASNYYGFASSTTDKSTLSGTALQMGSTSTTTTTIDGHGTNFLVGTQPDLAANFTIGQVGTAGVNANLGLITRLEGVTLNLISQDANGNITATGRKVEGSMDINTNVNVWQASTFYGFVNTGRDVVVNGTKAYWCVQEGTSASSGGPTGTTSNEIDGTVHWAFLGVWDTQLQYRMIRIGTMDAASGVAATTVYPHSVWIGGDNNGDAEQWSAKAMYRGDLTLYSWESHIWGFSTNTQTGTAGKDWTLRMGGPAYVGSGLGGGNGHINAGPGDGVGANGTIFVGEQSTALFSVTPNANFAGNLAASTGNATIASTSGTWNLGNVSGAGVLNASTISITGTATMNSTLAFAGSGAFASGVNPSSDVSGFTLGATNPRWGGLHTADTVGVVVHADTTGAQYVAMKSYTMAGIVTGDGIINVGGGHLPIQSAGYIFERADGGDTVLIPSTGNLVKISDANNNNPVLTVTSAGVLTLGKTGSSAAFNVAPTGLGVSGGWSAEAIGTNSVNANFTGPFRTIGNTGKFRNINCSAGVAGAAGSSNMTAQVYNVTDSASLCTCTLGACNTTANVPITCDCNTAFAAAKTYAVRLTNLGDCATAPQNMICVVEIASN